MQGDVYLLLTAVHADVVELDLAGVLAAAAEEAEAANEQVRVRYEANSLDRVARVGPASAVALEAVHRAEVLADVHLGLAPTPLPRRLRPPTSPQTPAGGAAPPENNQQLLIDDFGAGILLKFSVKVEKLDEWVQKTNKVRKSIKKSGKR
jgi:hypothetical protein